MNSKAEVNKLAPFKFLGFDFGPTTGNDEYPTTCPFSDKEGKMFVNAKTGLWNSFTSDKKGNIVTFLREYYILCLEHTTEKVLYDVVENRQLPMAAIKGKIAYNPLSDKYLIPHKNNAGSIINLTSWHPKAKRPLKVPGLPLTLIGLDHIEDNDLPMYIVEGEWDVIALEWLFASVGFRACVLGVPGANIFKDAWIGYFQNRNVNVLFDNDKAGFDGQKRIAEKIRTSCAKLQFLLWPELTRAKYDIRDLIIEEGGSPTFPVNKLKQVAHKISIMLSSQTNYERDAGQGISEQERKKDVKIPTREELVNKFKEHLKIEDDKTLAIMLGTIFANKISGDPVWLFLVAPPSGGKTEYLMTLNKSPLVETVSTLTPASLIPGTRISSDSSDPSLLKKVHKRNLAIKDLTTLLSAPAQYRDEIFGILRDAYDGYVEKWFATHKKSYTCEFGMLAGVTPAIDAYNDAMTTMGARAIYLRLDESATEEDEIEKIKRGLGNVGVENIMREELQDVVYRFLEQETTDKMPDFPGDTEDRLIAMAMFTSTFRASILKDKYTGEQVAPVFREVGIRLAKVYKKLCYGLCVYYGLDSVNEQVMNCIKDIARDTCPAINIEVVRRIHSEIINSEVGSISLTNIHKELSVSRSTVSRVIDDLKLQKIVVRVSGEERVKSLFKLSDSILRLIEKTKIFEGKKTKFFWKGKNNKQL